MHARPEDGFPELPLSTARALTYDSRRALTLPKPRLRGWSHLLGFTASVVVGARLVSTAPADERVVAGIYAATLSGLFGVSALYHLGTWSPRVHRLLQRADHAMIFLLIAGTATPLFAVAVSGGAAQAMLVALWATTACALLAHWVWMAAPEWLVGGFFVLLGCVGVAALPAVWVGSGIAAFVLLLGGGLVYITGAVIYHRRRPDPWPDTFGYHEVFHLCVCIAAALQYLAVSRVVR